MEKMLRKSRPLVLGTPAVKSRSKRQREPGAPPVQPLAAVARDNREATRLEEGEGFEVSNSIDNLSPGSPVLKTMAAIPYAKGLPYHTILGDDSGKGGGPGTTDGVVPWESAHIEGAVSELVIESDHNVPLDPAALLELRRILRLHLEER